MKLFSENLGSTNSNTELAALYAQFPDYAQEYLCQATLSWRSDAKKWIEELWRQFKPYADSNFLDEFKRQYAQRTWELYLGATLLSRGFRLGTHNDAGPDFNIKKDSDKHQTWIEATTTNRGDGKDKVPDMVYGVVQNVPEEEMMLRIANALNKKYAKYSDDLSKGLIKSNEPYIIAINRDRLSYTDGWPPLIIKVLFGIGHRVLRLTTDGNEHESREWSLTARPRINKRNGKGVPMLFFQNQEHSSVSAVIYCVDSILNSPRSPHDMGENFVIIHNTFAKNPLPDGFFPFGDEYKLVSGEIKKIREKKEWNM